MTTSNVISIKTRDALEHMVIELQEEVRKLRTIAERDELTGCLRRQAFLSMIDERRRFGWLPQQMTLVVVDLDHFKKVNDTYGHLAGDEVLKSAASVLMAHAPEGSLVCRMGGEEFVLLVPGTLEESAKSLETIRERIACTSVKTATGAIRVTASFGAADWNSDLPILEATARADGALYAAKREGRNRVNFASMEEIRKSA